jgi:tRNA (adenine57-N1/adenine58-N1)-methyltransferase
MARIVIRERKSKHDKKETEYLVPDEEHDFHTEQGSLTKEQLVAGGVVQVGKERFTILPVDFSNRLARIKRGAQIVQAKDIGLVIAETGLSKNDIVLDIGAGSGATSALFSRIAKQVYTYDINEEHLKIVEENHSALGVENVTVVRGDAYTADSIPHDQEIDLFFLDVPEPWRALETAKKALKRGAWLIAYTPCITQAMQLRESLKDDFFFVKTVEVLEREWKVAGQAVRPESTDFQHTAFLTFLRRI